jgi:hypothetical protein
MAAKKKATKKRAVKATAAPSSARAFGVGDRVRHETLGRGPVRAVVPAEGPGESPAYVVRFHRPKAKWVSKVVPADELSPADERAAD